MIHCKDCEFFDRGPDGSVILRCDPFSTIKEPECLHKWQLLKLQSMVKAYESTVAIYKRLAPLQEKMMRHIEHEIDDVDEADRWKYGLTEDDDDFDDDDETS